MRNIFSRLSSTDRKGLAGIGIAIIIMTIATATSGCYEGRPTYHFIHAGDEVVVSGEEIKVDDLYTGRKTTISAGATATVIIAPTEGKRLREFGIVGSHWLVARFTLNGDTLAYIGKVHGEAFHQWILRAQRRAALEDLARPRDSTLTESTDSVFGEEPVSGGS